jgi:hypothetical protein
MKLIWLVLLLISSVAHAAPTTTSVTDEIEATTTIDELTRENEIDGEIKKEEISTVATDIDTTTEQNEASPPQTPPSTENPTDNSPMTQQTTEPPPSDLIKMRIIQHYREKLRAHVFRALYVLLDEMRRRQQHEREQHAHESRVVESRAPRPLSAGSSCKCDDAADVGANDDSTVMVYDGNLRKYVHIDREDLLPSLKVSSHHVRVVSWFGVGK